MDMFRRRRRNTRARVSYPVTYKKVLNFAPVARAAATKADFLLVDGKDGIVSGQTGPTDANVPTGSHVDFIDIQYGCQNLGVLSLFVSTSIQNLISGQANTIDPRVVGSNPQRNQVHHQELRSIGPNQNATFHYRFKVPKQLGRVREDSKWLFVVIGSNAMTDNAQVIYKIKT